MERTGTPLVLGALRHARIQPYRTSCCMMAHYQARYPRLSLLRMRDHVLNVVGIIRDREIEAPSLVDTSLPQIAGFIVLLRVERRVLEVRGEKPQLLLKSPLNIRRSVFQGFDGAI